MWVDKFGSRGLQLGLLVLQKYQNLQSEVQKPSELTDGQVLYKSDFIYIVLEIFQLQITIAIIELSNRLHQL